MNKFKHALYEIGQHPFVLLISILTGICFGLLVYIYHFQLPLFSKSQIVICVVLAAAAAAGINFFLRKVTLPVFFSHSRSVRVVFSGLVLLLAILLGSILDYDIPHLYPLYPTHQIAVEMDLRDMPSEMKGVSFSHLQLAFRDVSYSELSFTGAYQIRKDDIFFPAGQVASITWQGITGEKAVLVFNPTAEPFTVKIRWDEQSEDLDLVQTGGSLPNRTYQYPVLPYEGRIVRLAAVPLIALLLFILINAIFSPTPYAGILLTIWLFIYLLYWPGIIGDVNVLAVDELLQGNPTDWHPIAFTLLVAFSTRFLASASSVLLMQMVSLALIFGNAFSFLYKKGVSRTILVVLTLLIALLPTNFMSIITLTNDIPYSIALLALTFLSFKIVISNGKWLDRPQNLFLLSLTASLAILFRYNGIPAVGFFFICLLVIYPRQWLKSLSSLVVVLLVWLAVNGPLSSMLNVTHETEGQFDNILLHHISAHVANGTPLTDDESGYLNELLPLEQWQYSCCSNTAMWANADFDRETFHANSAFNRQLELNLLQRNPSLELKHMLCASDIVWNLADGCEIKHPFVELIKGKYYWTRSYFPQYLESSFLPALVDPVSGLLNRMDASSLVSALLWRPAWYLYLAILCTILFCRRLKSARGFLVLAPALGQSLFLLVFNRVQNFRYQYCVVLVGLLLLALVFYQPDSKR
jgi:hypothetical protein